MYIGILRLLRDAVRKKRPEKWRTNSWGSPSQQCSSILVGLCQGFLSKEQCDNTGASPILT